MDTTRTTKRKIQKNAQEEHQMPQLKQQRSIAILNK
jgi:hypothetical protein